LAISQPGNRVAVNSAILARSWSLNLVPTPATPSYKKRSWKLG
jgi:hypothetical protein